MKKNLKVEILKNVRYSNDIFKMDIFSPYISKNSAPGQFVNIRCSPQGLSDPLLRRPFSIFDIEKGFNAFSILYQIKGNGTKYLSSLETNHTIDIVGPLGNEISIDKKVKKFFMISGGIGIAPLFIIAKKLNELNKKIIFVSGFRKEFPYPLETEIAKVSDEYFFYTEDGSYGKRGRVTDFIKENEISNDDIIYSCGPKNMLETLKCELAPKGLDSIAIMEEVMACGTGVCLGCAIKVLDDNRRPVYKKVCVDGPAFRLSKIVF